MRLPSLTLRGRDPSRAVTFSPATLLAPMDGYTDRGFRDLVVDTLGGGVLGGACTEFLRISTDPIPRKVLRREIGDPPRTGTSPGDPPGRNALLDDPPGRIVPVGAQLMAPDAEHVAATVANAEACGAAWIDLNFGCPVKRVVNKCAGSALLAHPERLGEIVAAAVGATGLPVTAKVRAGLDDCSPLDDVLDACAEAGAAAVTLHARLRRHSYATPATWDWIAHAAARLHARRPSVPLIGNGGIDSAADVDRMLRTTSCDAVMIGRAALADPWIFREAAGGARATFAEALAFARRYLDVVCPVGAPSGPLARYKAFLATIRAGGLFEGREDVRRALLREHDPARIREWLAVHEVSV